MIEKVEQLNNQAIQLAASGDYEEAIACFKRAITIDKNNYLIWYNLGVNYRDAGKLEDAKATLKTACNLAPDNEDVVETYATVCLLNKDYFDVANICKDVLVENPTWYNLWNILGVVAFENSYYDKAAEYFEQSVTFYPLNLDSLYNLKDTYEKLNNTKGMEECQAKIDELEKRNNG